MNREFFIGFDRVFDILDSFEKNPTSISNNGYSAKYPPYNIIKETDTKYRVELALAGFNKNEIEVSVQDKQLIIKGSKNDQRLPEKTIYSGISSRWFQRVFNLAENVEIKDVYFQNGLLTVSLEHMIPESKLPKKFLINDVASDELVAMSPAPQLLNEQVQVQKEKDPAPERRRQSSVGTTSSGSLGY